MLVNQFLKWAFLKWFYNWSACNDYNDICNYEKQQQQQNTETGLID